MSASPRPVYLFGPFTLHAAQRLLLRNRDVVPLTSKGFELLLALVENPRKVLTKDELLQRVWPDTVVEESNLTQTVFLLRKALGEKVKEHLYVVTVPKRGYCFVAEVRERLEGRQEARARELLGKRYSENSEAYQLCLKGRHFWEKRTAGAVERAIRYFQQAIEKDARYAKAYAGLADCYAILSHCSRLSPRQTLPKARAAAIQALAIDDTLVEAHTSLALVKMLYDWDWPGAAAEFSKALEPGHNYATAHHWYGMYLVARGQFDEAIAEVERAQQLEPLSLAINTDLGLVLYLARRYDEAIHQYRAAMDLDPSFSDAQAGILMAYNEMGMYYQPISEFLRSPETFSREVAARLEDAYVRSGAKGYWRAYLELAEAPSSEVHSSPYVRARIHAAIGDEGEALRWLEKAHEEHDGGLSLLKVDPGMDGLRDEPRFKAILERIGLS
ncbi:MAG TPA: winged helix-turn-helix domain-containing protein [Vicinamibacteria bacterium]|nr:winged helix-turn-helix domain-containing protein [Vicinamibacteria bacterium]